VSAVDQHRAAEAARPAAGSLVRTVVWTLVAIQVAVVSWAALRGWFYGDDLAIRGLGATYPWLSPDYLLQPWGGHFMPAAFAVAQVFSRLGSFSYGAIAISLAAGQAFVAIAFARLLLRHFGARWRILLPLGILLFSIPILQATVWWASALNALPFLACLVLAVDRALRLARRTSGRDVAWILALTVVALGFFEKAVLLPVVVAFVLLCTTPGTRGGLSVPAVLRRYRGLFLGFAVVYAGWFVAYRASATSGFAGAPSLDTAREQLASGVVGTFLTSLAGGPWEWADAGSAYTSVAAAMAAGAFVAGALLVLAVQLLPRGPRVLGAVVMASAYAVGLVVLLTVGRTQFLFPGTGLPRYFADLAVVVAIAVALSTARLVVDPAPHMLSEPAPQLSPRRIVAAAVAANVLVVSWLVAAVALASSLPDPAVKSWTTNALRTAQAAQSSSPLLEGVVPETVMSPLLFPYQRYSWFFAGVDGVPSVAESTDELRTFADDGRLVEAHVQGPSSLPGPAPNCGRVVTSEGAFVPMETQIVDFSHTMKISYLAAEATGLEVQMGSGPTVTVPVRKGFADVYLSFVGGGTSVSLRATSPGVVVCVSDVTIGAVAPGPAPARTQ